MTYAGNYVDYFTDQTVRLIQTLPAGMTVSEALSALSLSIPAGGEAQWWDGSFSVPMAEVRLPPDYSGDYRITARLKDITIGFDPTYPGGQYDTGLALFEDGDDGYAFAYREAGYPLDATAEVAAIKHAAGASSEYSSAAAAPHTVPSQGALLLRMELLNDHLGGGYRAIECSYSEDEGATWVTHATVNNLDAEGGCDYHRRIGLYASNSDYFGWWAFAAAYDYLQVETEYAVTLITSLTPSVRYDGHGLASSPEGFVHLITDSGQNQLDQAGHLVRDYTVASQCRFRLKCQRGKWALGPEVGSRFHELKTLKDAQARCQTYAEEALQPLKDQGIISGVSVPRIEVDQRQGRLLAEIAITVPEGKMLSLGLYQLGAP